MRKLMIVTACCFVLISGCGESIELDSSPIVESSLGVPESTDRSVPLAEDGIYSDAKESYLDAYAPWQLEIAKELGIKDEILISSAEQTIGGLDEWYGSTLNVPLPPQSLMDEALLDAYLVFRRDHILLRSEMAVLLTEHREDTFFSVIVVYAMEGRGGTFLIAWKQVEGCVHIMGGIAADTPFTIPPVNATDVELAGKRIMFSELHNDMWCGGEERAAIHPKHFIVSMESGEEIIQDVSSLPCVMIFLPEGTITNWTLTDADGELIWDSLENTWRG